MRLSRPLAALALLGLCACSSTYLPAAAYNNVVDTVTIYALVGTPITSPSGFYISTSQPVRTDLSSNFDFAYNVSDTTKTIRDSAHVFLTQRVLGLGTTSQTFFPGFLIQPGQTFEQITSAPSNGYDTIDTIRVAVGQSYIMRSGVVNCASYGVPNYGKLNVLAINDTNRSITFQVLVNLNCGYKGLVPGTPTK